VSARGLGSLRVATLGGPGTFAGLATDAACERFPELGDVVYHPTMDEVWDAVGSRTADIGILGAETSSTGLTEIAEHLLHDDSFFVLGEVVVPYRCMLLGKPGASTEQIRLVVGHGSLRLCRRSLSVLVPDAEVRVHPQNSLAAARDVLNSDGSMAVVGTSRSKEEFGLDILAEDVDGGCEGAWWLLSADLRLSEHPDHVVVVVESERLDTLHRLMTRMASFGMAARSVMTRPLGSEFRSSHLVVFEGGPLPVRGDVLLWDLDGCRLVGAFSSREAVLP
jgi:prephenate dehydratase